MDYEEITKKLGSFGRYQKRLLTIVFLPVIYNIGAPATVFLMGDQLHRCKLPDLDNDTYAIQSDLHRQQINETIPVNADGSYKKCSILRNGTEIKCSEWVYDKTVFNLTSISQFDMVCNEKLRNSLVASTFFFGFITGGILMVPLGDIIGRRMVVCMMVTLQCVVNLALPFSPNIEVFAVLRFLSGASSCGFYHAAFLIGMELVGPKERLIAGTVILIAYTTGEFILVVLAYFFRDWRWLQLSISLPMVLSLVFWWPRILPESPRWLISRGRTKEAQDILRRAAKANKVKLHYYTKVNKEEDVGICKILQELFHSRKLIFRWIIVIFNWFVISLTYFGLVVNIGQFGGNIFINFTISVAMETLGYLLCFLLDLTGRKPMHLTIMYGTGIACLASIFPLLYGSASLNWLVILFSMIGKLGVSAAFGEIFIYTGELFPTVIRSFIIGMSSTAARVASALSPYLYKIADGKFGKALPLIIYVVLTLIVTTASIALPETRRIKLLEKVKDADLETTSENVDTSLARSEIQDEDADTTPL